MNYRIHIYIYHVTCAHAEVHARVHACVRNTMFVRIMSDHFAMCIRFNISRAGPLQRRSPVRRYKYEYDLGRVNMYVIESGNYKLTLLVA